MIEVKNLTKYYGKNPAIDNLNFTVNENEIVGFLGPNGAGKTTTMNIITGYISQSSGEIFINEINTAGPNSKTKKITGYMPDNPPLYPDMKVTEYLNFAGKLKGVKDQKKLSEIMDQLQISDVADKLICNLSKGYRQRVGFAQALIGMPSVLILDEPTSGLDPKQIIYMRDLIKSFKKNHTILISSHILSEINAVADRVIIINKGKIAADNTPSELSKNLMHGKKIAVRIRGDYHKIFSTIEKKSDFNCIEHTKNTEPGSFDLILENSNGDDIREKFFHFAVQNDFALLMMKPFDMSLEEVFLQVTCENENADEKFDNTQDEKNIENNNQEA